MTGHADRAPHLAADDVPAKISGTCAAVPVAVVACLRSIAAELRNEERGDATFITGRVCFCACHGRGEMSNAHGGSSTSVDTVR